MLTHLLFFFKKFGVTAADPTPVSEGFRAYGMPRVPGVKNIWKPPATPMDPRRRTW